MSNTEIDPIVDLALKALSAPERRRLFEAVLAVGPCSFERLSLIDGGAQSTAAKRIRQLCEAGLIADDGRKRPDRYRRGPAMDAVSKWLASLQVQHPSRTHTAPSLQTILTALRPTTNKIVLQYLVTHPDLSNQGLAKCIGRSEPITSRATQQMLQAGVIAKSRHHYWISLRVRYEAIERLVLWSKSPLQDFGRLFNSTG